MNERIEELFGKALDKAVPHTWTSLSHAEVESVIKVFAELIVRECSNIGEMKEQGYSQFDPDTSVGWYMRQHFGVKDDYQ